MEGCDLLTFVGSPRHPSKSYMKDDTPTPLAAVIVCVCVCLYARLIKAFTTLTVHTGQYKLDS